MVRPIILCGKKFTTKPLVDDTVFRRIAEIPTPWPCFVIAARDEFIREQPEILNTILDIINTTTAEFKQIPSIDRTIASRYGQKIEDVREWLDLTEWSQQQIDEDTIDQIQKYLLKLKLIPEGVSYSKLIHRR